MYLWLMTRLLPWLVMMGIYYVGIAPAIEQVIRKTEGAMSAGGPLPISLLGDLEGVLLIWLPLIGTGGVLLVGYVLSVGTRGTSFRP